MTTSERGEIVKCARCDGYGWRCPCEMCSKFGRSALTGRPICVSCRQPAAMCRECKGRGVVLLLPPCPVCNVNAAAVDDGPCEDCASALTHIGPTSPAERGR